MICASLYIVSVNLVLLTKLSHKPSQTYLSMERKNGWKNGISPSLGFCMIFRWTCLCQDHAQKRVLHNARSIPREVWTAHGRSFVHTCITRRDILVCSHPSCSWCHYQRCYKFGSYSFCYCIGVHRYFLYTDWWALFCCLHWRHPAYLHLHWAGK